MGATLFGNDNKAERSIARLKEFEPPEGYFLSFSGGKDSIVMYKLAEMSSVKFSSHYRYTGIEAPTVVRFIKEKYPSVKFGFPRRTYGKQFMRKCFPPLRQKRWCCELLKEDFGTGTVLLGLRAAESAKRSKRPVVEWCKDRKVWLVCPIIDWSDNDIWEFIRKWGLPYPDLYDNGFRRIGCLACPMAPEHERRFQLKMFPKHKKMYLALFRRAFSKLKRRLHPPKIHGDTPEEWFEWWLTRKHDTSIKGQCFLFDN